MKSTLMASGSTARASSDIDFVPGMVPFEWEEAPGRPAVSEIVEIVESLRLPPPPGRQFKDGFLSPAQIPNVEGSSHKEKKSFKLQYLKPSKKKTSFKSRESKRLEADVEDTSGIFSPVSSHRITRKVLVKSRMISSCFGLCWHESSDKRSDSVAESDRNVSSAASGSSLSSPRDGQTRKSVIDGAGKPGSRFMASMLVSESDESDHETAADGGPGITDHKARLSDLLKTPAAPGGIRISETVATPRAPPGTPASSELRIVENVATPRAPVFHSWRKTIPGSSDDSTSRYTASDAHSAIGSPGRGLHLGSSRSTLSWKSCEQNKEELDPLAAFVAAHGQEPVFANKRSEHGDEPQVSCGSLAGKLFSELSLTDLVLPGRTTRNKMQSSPTTRSSVGSSDYPFDNPKANLTRGRSSLSLRGRPSEEQVRSSATRHIPRPAKPRKAKQLQIVTPKALETDVKAPVSPRWLEQLKSSSLWPHHDSGGESGDDSGGSSPHSYEYHTPRAGSSLTSPHSSSTSSAPAPVVSTPSKPATIVVSKEVLKSSSMLQRKQQQQDRYAASRSSFAWDQDITEVPSSSTALEHYDTPASTCAPEKVSTSEQVENLTTSGPPETSNSGSNEMRKEEPKAAAGPSGRSFPIYLHRKGSTVSKDQPKSR